MDRHIVRAIDVDDEAMILSSTKDGMRLQSNGDVRMKLYGLDGETSATIYWLPRNFYDVIVGIRIGYVLNVAFQRIVCRNTIED